MRTVLFFPGNYRGIRTPILFTILLSLQIIIHQSHGTAIVSSSSTTDIDHDTLIIEEDQNLNNVFNDSSKDATVDSLKNDAVEQQEEETTTILQEEDNRTLLDLFGEAAKEYLTKRVIPDTDEDCRWDWRYARCNPKCSCEFKFQWGDFHLGRSCRLQDETTTTKQCNNNDVVPDTLYAKWFALGIQVRQTVKKNIQHRSNRIAIQLMERMNTMQVQACRDIPPLECNINPLLLGGSAAEAYQRSIPEKIFCKHIPSSCGNDDDYNFFVREKEDEENVNDWFNNNNQFAASGGSTSTKQRRRMMKLAAAADWDKYFGVQ